MAVTLGVREPGQKLSTVVNKREEGYRGGPVCTESNVRALVIGLGQDRGLEEGIQVVLQ